MKQVVLSKMESEFDQQFVTEADWIPSFWNYLVGLDRDDLIAELIQNDLDQEATRTEISFENGQLVCEGNGKPVDADGWQRLRIIQGAGNSVPAKRGKIGVKNHGLKTAFTLGDEIRLMSAGRAIVQTLHAKGRNKSPYPGASDKPTVDLQASTKGCRIVIQYRTAPIKPTQGESVVLGVPTEDDIDKLFQNACSSIPEQFAGIVSPGAVARYEIVLRHWKLGEAHFLFSCTRAHKITKRMETFRRRCKVTGTVSKLPKDSQERAMRRLILLKGRLRKRIAEFYRSGRYFFVEVSWPTNRAGKPIIGTGRFRYPIGYPEDSKGACTGHGTYFNVPVVSNTERHAPATNEETNGQLREACDVLLVDALAHHAIPRWGPDGLNPLVPSRNTDNENEAVRPLLAELAKQNKLPVLDWRTAVNQTIKGNRHNLNALICRNMNQRKSVEAKRYHFVIPIVTWVSNTILPALSFLCPRSEMQLHPRTNADIIRLLTDQKTSGFAIDYITFDEDDVLARVTSDGNECFGAIAGREQEFAEPMIARSYLDLITLALDAGKCSEDEEEALIQSLLLPDSHNQATPISRLYSSNLLLHDIPSLSIPPILHLELVGHHLLRRRKWRRPKFKLTTFLESDALRDADENIRLQFWQWLCRNVHLVPPRDRSKLAELAIWPDKNGSLARISDLCEPRSKHVKAVLADFIRPPSEQLRRSKLVSFGKRGRMSIRSIPTIDEIADWLDSQLTPFELDSIPDVDTIEALNRFENDLAILTKNKATLRLLKKIETTSLPALAQDGSLQLRAYLVMSSHVIRHPTLPKRFLLTDCRRFTTNLNKLSPALTTPSTSMVIDALAEDSSNFHCLQPRLQLLLHLTRLEADELLRVTTLPIIPLNGQPRQPSELTFKGNQGDFWGSWKEKLPTTGLTQDDQRRFRKVGVTRGVPNSTTSRAFFKWLGTLDESTLKQHVPCVIRQILHSEGPTHWANNFTDIPFVPVESQVGLQFASLRKVQQGPVYLSDAGNIAEDIIAKDSRVLLVVDRVKEVTKPITEQLRQLGVKSLREALNEPERVSGVGNITQALEDMNTELEILRSSALRRTFQKRLASLGVQSDLIRHDWHDRLSRVKQIQIADEVEACYRFRQRVYRIETDAGFDFESGVFWMKCDGDASVRELYESIAKALIFKPTAEPMHHFTLERAVSREILDRSFRPLSDPNPTAEASDMDEQGEYQENNINGETTEAVFGHSPFQPDETRNLPKSNPIPAYSTTSAHRHGEHRGEGRPGQHDNSSNPTPRLEKKHIEILKSEQYASHCQMCLCERTPQKLAPKGSYIFWQEVRKSVVEAHHVDLKSAGGARHAGNLILLCKLHHNNFGRRLTRAAITAALQGKVEERAIRFGKDTEVKGKQIEYELRDTGEVVKLFFTDHHTAYWLTEV